MDLGETLRAMLAAGCTAEQLVAFVEKFESQRKAKATEKKRRQRSLSSGQGKDVPGTSGDIGGHSETSGDIGGHSADEEKKKNPPDPLKEKNTHSPKKSPPTGGQKKGSHLPSDWAPSQAEIEYGEKLGFNHQKIDNLAEEMRLWAASAAGPIAVKRDWSAAFKRWMRRESERRGPNARGDPRPRGRKYSDPYAQLLYERTINRQGHADEPAYEIIPPPARATAEERRCRDRFDPERARS